MAKQNYKQDFYALKAKKEGYSARSVYKLQEIHTKHLDLQNISNVLDLGAAPGSWTQYLQKHLSKSAHIFSVDIVPLKIQLNPFPKVTQIQADFTDPTHIEKIVALGPFDLIISDAAPLTTGNRGLDTAKSEQLVETIIHIAKKSLIQNSCLVTKIFQGQGCSSLLRELRTIYSKVSCFRPKAVKPSSFETYIICR